MITCRSCAKSFEMPTPEFGGVVLVCRPDGDELQAAGIPCLKYQRERYGDEPEEVIE